MLIEIYVKKIIKFVIKKVFIVLNIIKYLKSIILRD